MTTRLLLSLFLPWAVASILCGCGEKEVPVGTKTASVSSGKAIPPCQLVTAADVKAIFSHDVVIMADEPETCIYHSVVGNVPFGMLTLSLIPSANEKDAKLAMQISLKMQGFIGDTVNDGMKTTDNQSQRVLDGIGDEAYLHVGNLDLMSTTQLILRKGHMVMNIGVIGLRGEAEISKLESIARLTADKL